MTDTQTLTRRDKLALNAALVPRPVGHRHVRTVAVALARMARPLDDHGGRGELGPITTAALAKRVERITGLDTAVIISALTWLRDHHYASASAGPGTSWSYILDVMPVGKAVRM